MNAKDLCKSFTDDVVKGAESEKTISAAEIMDKLMESYVNNDPTVSKNLVKELDVEKEVAEANSRYESATLEQGFPQIQASLYSKGLVRNEDVITSDVATNPEYDKALEEVKEIENVKKI